MSIGTTTIGTSPIGDGVGGPYVPIVIVIPNVVRQDAVWQADENIGYVSDPSKDAVWQVDENIGYVSDPSKDAVWQADENIQLVVQSNPWTDPMNDLSNWDILGSWVISPAGFGYYGGNANANGNLMRIDSSAFVEIECYLDQNSANWLAFKINVGTGSAGWDNEGCGILLRNTSVEPFLLSGGSVITLPSWPGSAANMVKIGLHRRSNTAIDLYVNGVKKLIGLVPTQTMAGNKVMFSAYNGAGPHINKVYFADVPPYGGSGANFLRIIRR